MQLIWGIMISWHYYRCCLIFSLNNQGKVKETKRKGWVVYWLVAVNEVKPLFQSTQWYSVASAWSFHWFPLTWDTLRISLCHLGTCSHCETPQNVRPFLLHRLSRIAQAMKVFVCRSNSGAIRLKPKMPEQVSSVSRPGISVPFESQFLNISKKKSFHCQRISVTMELRMPLLCFSISNVYFKLTLRLSVMKRFRYLGGQNVFDKKHGVIFP